MRCPGCDYELWNLKAGPCPECGRPFKPSEFDLLANAVKFCCPHCDQAYYGTSERGQLQPPEFDCVSCGRHVTTDDMLLRPAEELGKRQPTRSTNPWLEPNRKRRWFATIGAGLGQPGRLLEATPALGSLGGAMTYASVTIVVAAALSIMLSILTLATGGNAGPLISVALGVLLAPLAYLFIWTAVTHGVLKLLRQPTPDGIGRTFQALAFTSGGWLFSLVPCLGIFMGFVAWSACAPAAVYGAHRCRGWAAAVATLVTPVLVVLATFGMYLWFIISAMNTAHYAVATHGWAMGTQLDPDTIQLANQLRTDVNAGNPPLHGANLLGGQALFSFTVFRTQQAFDAPIGRHTASALENMSDFQRTSELAAITASWPQDVTAHRVGRIIFTHHGIDPADDPRLWLMIELPSSPGEAIADAVHLSGASMFNTRTGAQPAIDQQNRLRAAAGLPPLPDYQTLSSGLGPWTPGDAASPTSTPGIP